MSVAYTTMISMYPRPNQIWDGVRDQALAALEAAVTAGSHIDPDRLARLIAISPPPPGEG